MKTIFQEWSLTEKLFWKTSKAWSVHKKRIKNILSVPFAINGFISDITHRKSNPLELKHLINNQQSFKRSQLQNSTQNSQQWKLQLIDVYCCMLCFKMGFTKSYRKIIQSTIRLELKLFHSIANIQQFRAGCAKPYYMQLKLQGDRGDQNIITWANYLA